MIPSHTNPRTRKINYLCAILLGAWIGLAALPEYRLIMVIIAAVLMVVFVSTLHQEEEIGLERFIQFVQFIEENNGHHSDSHPRIQENVPER